MTSSSTPCEFPALPQAKQTRVTRATFDDVSSVSEESVSSFKFRQPQTKTLIELLEDVAETRRRIKRARRNGKRYVKPRQNVTLSKTVYEDTTLYLYLDDREDNITSDVLKGTRIIIDGFEKFHCTGETWYRICHPYKRYWIHESALKKPLRFPRPVVRNAPLLERVDAPKPTPLQFVYRETVECFVEGAWVKGEVQTCKPLRIAVNGRVVEVEPLPVYVRKVQGRTLRVCVDNLPIRSTKTTRRNVVQNVPRNSLVEVISFEGYYAKVHKPCVGWIQWRTEERVAVLEPHFKNPFLGKRFRVARDVSVSGYQLARGAQVSLLQINDKECKIRFTRNVAEGVKEIVGKCPLSALQQRVVAQPQLRVTNLPKYATAFEVSKFICEFSWQNFSADLQVNDIVPQTNKKGETSLLVSVLEGNREVNARSLFKLSHNKGFFYDGVKLQFDYTLHYLKTRSCPFNWVPESNV